MPPRLPTPADFPAHIPVAIIPPARPSDSAINVLILLHGLGDSEASFATLARRLALPETVCVCVQAPQALPFDLGGYHWGDDIVFDHHHHDPTAGGGGALDMDAGFSKATSLLRHDILDGALVGRCGYARARIVLFGFGQGGMAAMALAASLPLVHELAGLVSVGGPLPSIATPPPAKRKTPVLLLGGDAGTALTPAAVKKARDTFEHVEYVRWKKSGDGMPTNREEMLPVMLFFSRRLQSRRGVPAGAVQVA